jgi:hypothetical protein
LKLQQDHEILASKNFQLSIENEDLRDRLNLLGEESGGIRIDYVQFIPPGFLQMQCDSI